jgi:hypothetical protein
MTGRLPFSAALTMRQIRMRLGDESDSRPDDEPG